MSEGRVCHYNYAVAPGGDAECEAACDAQPGCTEFSTGGGLGCRYALDSTGCCTNVPGADLASCTAYTGWNAAGCADGSCKFYASTAYTMSEGRVCHYNYGVAP